MFSIKHRNWRLLHESEGKTDIAIKLFDAVQSNNFKVKDVLKDHHRSKVLRVDILGYDLVLKIPTEKNQKKWIQFTTLFRSGEAFKNLQGMVTLKNLEIKTTTPMMAADFRPNGMVVDSWLLYEYLDGQPCLNRKEHYSEVVATLKKIHSQGLLHGDPQIRNFIATQTGIHVIDSNPTKKGISGFDTAYEFAYLRKSTENIEGHFGEITNFWWYRFAVKYDIYDRKLASKRKAFKAFLGFKVVK